MALPTQQTAQPVRTGSTQWQDLPVALQQIYQQGWGTAAQQMGTPYTTYQNPRIADIAPLQRQAMGTVGGLTQALTPLYQKAGAALEATPLASTGKWTDPGVAGSYMSPYTSNVVDRLATLGNRNLTENIIPNINSTFVGGGQFGSTRNADFMNRAIRDTQEGILGQQAQALESGYGTAGNLYGSDAVRALDAQRTNQTVTQNAATGFGNLAGGMATTLGGVASQQAGLGALQQGLNQQNLDLAYQDFMRQQGYPMTNLQSAMSVVNPTAANTAGSGTANQYTMPQTSTANKWIGGLSALADLYKNW